MDLENGPSNFSINPVVFRLKNIIYHRVRQVVINYYFIDLMFNETMFGKQNKKGIFIQ